VTTLTPLAISELDLEEAVLLPKREEMAFLNIVNIQAVNLALALNLGAAGSSAVAAAVQQITVMQS
jgi:hypothetical protein